MVQKLNKFFFYFVCWLTLNIQAQQSITDYKSQSTFDNFKIKRNWIACWQIQQLHSGYLVLRLPSQRKAINLLLLKGDTAKAYRLAAETMQKNKHRIRAFLNDYTFSKVLFTYDFLSDSLKLGHTKGIFLDSNLTPLTQTAQENKFYLIAEEDFVYNSSIGFIKEDSATQINEQGYPIRKMALVVKNKYGHQLKGPFPYAVKDYVMSKTKHHFKVSTDTNALLYFNCASLKNLPATVSLEKCYTPERIAQWVQIWNDQLVIFYNKSLEMFKSEPPNFILPYLY